MSRITNKTERKINNLSNSHSVSVKEYDSELSLGKNGHLKPNDSPLDLHGIYPSVPD